jgi:uncharacterized membrane protein YdjX (TVP38/TMEM64 family)
MKLTSKYTMFGSQILVWFLLRGEGIEGFHAHAAAAKPKLAARTIGTIVVDSRPHPAARTAASPTCASRNAIAKSRACSVRLSKTSIRRPALALGSRTTDGDQLPLLLPTSRGLGCRGGALVPSASASKVRGSDRRSPLSRSSTLASRLRDLEGGGSVSDSTSSLVPTSASVRRFVTVSLATALSIFLVYAVYQNRELLMNKERVQEETLKLLHRLNDGSGHPGRSLAMYSVGMALWELCSLSTIPVETAAGMVFGWRAAPFSVLGKLMGAGTAFALGRTWLNRWATDRLAHNSVWKLVTTSRRFSPWSTAFLMKYSCFPEFVKNFGSSFLAVSPFQFAVATLIHGGSFTLLWTWWGVETTLRLQSPADHVASVGLKIALVVAGFVGVVATPAVMTWWISSLRQEAVARKA